MSDLFQLPEFIDSRGKLTFVEEVTHLPFQIRAVYLLAKEDIPDKISLPSHAFLMAPVGNITVNSDTILHGINNGILTKPAEDIYLDKSSDSLLLILSEKAISHLTPLQIPFRARRAYFMTDIHKGKSRGNHAHLTTSQLIYSLQGAFEVELDNGQTHITGLSCGSSYRCVAHSTEIHLGCRLHGFCLGAFQSG